MWMEGSPGQRVTNDKITSAITRSHAKAESDIPPGRPYHPLLLIVPDIDPYPLLTVASGFPLKNTQRIMPQRPDQPLSLVSNGTLIMCFLLNTALT